MTTVTQGKGGLNATFWDMFDLSTNVERAVHAVRGIRTFAGAAITALALAIVSYTSFWLMVYFDLMPTYRWAVQWSEKISANLPASVAGFAVYVVVTLTVFPTVIELTSSRFADVNLKLFSVMFWLFLVFDFITDWPAVKIFMTVFDFSTVGGGKYLYTIANFLFLIMATIGFEVVFIVSFIAMLACIYQANQASNGRQRASNGR